MRATLLVAVAMGCAHAPAPILMPPVTVPSPYIGYDSPRYADPRMWLCLPGRAGDACTGDLTATEVRADGSRRVIPDIPAATDPPVDCFYVYPTQDSSPDAKNHENLADLGTIPRTALMQVGQFRAVCRLFVPLYRQASIGTYSRWKEHQEPYFAAAFSDVAEAFLHYMGQYNHGRKVVLIGHSQGGEMVSRLLKRFFDADPVMRARLLYAFPIGALLAVRNGQTVGGDFMNIPICTRRGDTGCIVGYRSFRAGQAVDPDGDEPAAGMTSICVNPADLTGNGAHPLRRSYFFIGGKQVGDRRTPPFVVLPDYYTSRCVDREDRYRYLEIGVVPGDPRVNPIDFNGEADPNMGLHGLDMQFPLGDLVDLVAAGAR